MAARYLLDTNHLGMATRTRSLVYRRICEERESGVRFGTCIPVICELEVGIQNLSDPERSRHGLRGLIQRHVRIWPMDSKTSEIYGSLVHRLRERGRVLSQVDIMIAALAIQHDLILLTTDRDFEGLPEVKAENWS